MATMTTSHVHVHDQINQLTDNLLQNPIPPIEYEAELGYPGAPELRDEIGSRFAASPSTDWWAKSVASSSASGNFCIGC